MDLNQQVIEHLKQHRFVNLASINMQERTKLYNVASQYGFDAFKWCVARATEAKGGRFAFGAYVAGIAKKNASARPWAAGKPVAGARFVREDD